MKTKLAAMLLAAGAMLGAWAETITIGSGTESEEFLPTTSFYNYSLTQQIYASDEIGGSCTIKSIAFKNVGIEQTRTFDIYLVHTDKESFGNVKDWIAVTDVDNVFSGEVTFSPMEWTTIALDVPFDYNGTNNLAVIIDDNTGTYSSGLKCLAFDAVAQAIRIYSDSTNFDPFNPGDYSGLTKEVKNQIKLGVSDYKPVGLGVAEFGDLTYYVDEGDILSVTVMGGCEKMPARATVCLQYQTAAAADIDLKNGDVDGLVPNGGLKFPLTLTWDKGDTEPKTIRIPVKADNLVEGNERLFLQLAEPVGMELGPTEIAQVTIVDMNTKALKASVTPYRPKKDETVASHTIDVVTGSRRGFVAGSGEYTAGSKLTIVAEARPDSEFKGWEKDGVLVSEKAKYQFTVTENATYTAIFDEAAYVDAVALSADGGKATGSGYCAAGKKVTLKASANKNNRFVGWYAFVPTSVVVPDLGELPPPPTFDRASLALVATTPSLVIDRTTNPRNNSPATSTVLTGVDTSTTFFAVFEQDPLVSVIPVDADGVNYDAGKVTGAGRYEPGKKVTLKATAGKGYVFAGFYNASRRLVDETRSATYTFEMGDFDVPLTAVFVSPEEDAASIKVVATIPDYDGPVVLDAENPDAFVTYCGVEVDCQIEATALSATTVKASGLPAGVKLVQDKATGVWSLAGAPTAASKYDSNGDPEYYEVKLTVTTAGKSSKTYLNYWRVEPLPDWAVGTFDGAVLGNMDIKATKEVFFPEPTVEGIFSMTVAANGKISGKYQMDGKSWTFSAPSFSEAYVPWRALPQPEFYATLIAKSGKEVVTNVIELSDSSTCDPKGDKVARGTVFGDFYYGEGMGRKILIEGVQNQWKVEPWKSAMKDFVQNTPTYVEEVWSVESGEPVRVGTVSLKFAASGAVTAKGDFVVGRNPTTNKDITYSATCSTTFIPMLDGCNDSISLGSWEPSRDVLLAEPELPGAVYVVFPPNAQKNFPGWSKTITIGDVDLVN